MPDFPKKRIFHSNLRDAGTTEIMLLERPAPNAEAAEPLDLEVMVRGDPRAHLYRVENPAIARQLVHAPLRTWLRVEARGTRSEAALDILAVLNTPDSDIPHVPPATPLSARMLECLLSARDVIAEYRNRTGEDPSDEVRAVATTLLIQSNTTGLPLGTPTADPPPF